MIEWRHHETNHVEYDTY